MPNRCCSSFFCLYLQKSYLISFCIQIMYGIFFSNAKILYRFHLIIIQFCNFAHTQKNECCGLMRRDFGTAKDRLRGSNLRRILLNHKICRYPINAIFRDQRAVGKIEDRIASEANVFIAKPKRVLASHSRKSITKTLCYALLQSL